MFIQELDENWDVSAKLLNPNAFKEETRNWKTSPMTENFWDIFKSSYIICVYVSVQFEMVSHSVQLLAPLEFLYLKLKNSDYLGRVYKKFEMAYFFIEK